MRGENIHKRKKSNNKHFVICHIPFLLRMIKFIGAYLVDLAVFIE